MSEESETPDKAALIGLKNRLVKTIEQLSAINEEVQGLIDVKDVEADELENFKVFSGTHEMVAQITLKLESIDVSNKNSLSIESTSATSVSSNRLKLPKLELPVFKGDPLKWQGFWDMFSKSIHENETISDIDRFTYLKRYLSGPA